MEEVLPLLSRGGKSRLTAPPAERSSIWSILRLMRPYLWPDQQRSRLAVLCTFLMVIIAKICSVTAPLFLARAANMLNEAVNETSTRSSTEDIVVQVGIYCTLLFAAVIFAELQTLVYMHVKQEANVILCTNAYKHVLSLSVNWHISQKTGSTLRILDRGGKASDELIGFTLLNFIPGLVECFCVCLLFIWKFHQLEIFVVAAVGIVMYGSITRYITSQRKELRKESNIYDNLYSEMASDSFANIEQVKCCNGELLEVERYSNAVTMYNKSRKFILSATGILKISQQAIISLTLFVSLYITVNKVLTGRMNIGDFIAVHSYCVGMFNPLNSLGGNYNKIVQALVDVCQLADLMKLIPTVQNRYDAKPIPLLHDLYIEQPEERISRDEERSDMELIKMNHKLSSTKCAFSERDISIQFENVCFDYNSSDFGHDLHDEVSDITPEWSTGLQNMSFTVPCGTTTAIVGSSGSGKTTLSRMMFRFYDPNEGRILFNDYDIKDYTQESIRSCISLVPQDTILFNNTILYNIQYGRMPGASMEEVEAACQAAQILEFIEGLPNKWETMVGNRGMKLSGGEKQRVSIARCLLRNPPVIVLDEATSSLDAETEKSVQLSLQSLTEGQRTVIVIAHRLATIQNSDQILVVDKGRIIQKGNHDELMQEYNGKYKTLWESQFRENSMPCSD